MIDLSRARGHAGKLAATILVSTLTLTACFYGLVSLLGGTAADIGARFPAYVLAMGCAFVVAVVALTRYRTDGRTVLAAAVGFSVLALVVATLAGEGLMYALRHTDRVIGSHVLVYLFAGGLIGTGLSFWLVHYWREFANLEPEETSEAAD